MPIPDGEQYIPRGDDMVSAFDLVKAKYPNIPITVEGILSLPEKRIKTIIEDIFTTGVAFFSK